MQHFVFWACVFWEMHWKMLFYNLSIVWNIKILLINFVRREIEDDNGLWHFFGWCDIDSKFGEFWGMFRQWQMRSFGTKKLSFEKQVETCSGPKNWVKVLLVLWRDNHLHWGGYVFTCIRWLVDWFVSWITQKLLNGFPQNVDDGLVLTQNRPH